MNSCLRNLSWRDLRGHTLRTLLTILSVAAGIAAVTSIYLSAGGAKQKIAELEKSLIGTADLEVVASDSKLFAPEDVLSILTADSHVKHATSELRRRAPFYGNDGTKLGANGVGLPPDPAAVDQLELVGGRFWSQSGEELEVVLEAGFAKALHIELPAPGGGLSPASSNPASTNPNDLLQPIGDKVLAGKDSLEFTVTKSASHADDEVTFSLAEASTAIGMTIDPVSGVFSWTPAVDQPRGVYDVQVIATNAANPESSATANFKITLKNKPEVLVRTQRGNLTFTVVGIVSVHNAQAMTNAELAYFRMSDMQKYWKATDKVSRIRIDLKEDADAEVVQERLQEILPDIVAIRRPEGFSAFAEETMRSVDLGLLFAWLLSLVLGGCTIFNTFLISVGERRRQWGILRAIGATKSQLLRMIIWESLAIGFIGSLLGIALGLGGAYGLSMAISNVLQVTSAPPVWNFSLLAKILFLGLLISVIAALIPARQATKISPLEAMRGTINIGNERFPILAAVVALFIWLLSTVVIGASLAGYLPAEASIIGGVAMMLGFVFWVPPILPTISRGLSWILSNFWLRCESEIAVRQTCRNQIRTSLTVAVLIVALANGIGMGHALLNNVADVKQWYKRAMLGDVILFPIAPVDVATEQEFAKLGNPSLETVNFATVRVNHQSADLISRRLPDDQKLPWDTGKIPADEVRQKLKAGEVVVSTVLAQKLNVKVGDTINIDNPAGRAAEFRIACLVKDYHQGGLTVCLDRDVAQKQVGLEGVAIYLLKWPAGNAAEFRLALDAFANGKLQVNSQETLNAQLDGMMLGIEVAFWVVLVLGMVVASFATFNTLTMNVLEQTREIGLLRIVGATRRQIFWTIMSQALIIGMLGVALGLLAGLTSTYLMHVCSGPLLGRTVDFIWRPGLTSLCLVFSLLLGALAAFLPARRASRLPVLTAIHEE